MEDRDVVRGLARLEESVVGLKTQMSGALSRIDEGSKRETLLYDIDRKLDVMQANTEARLKHIESEQAETNKRLEKHGQEIDDIKQKPAKRWDSATTQIIALIIAGVIGWWIQSIIGGK